jgi:hypothetical protein
MRTLILLCAALAGCTYAAPAPCRPFDTLCDGGAVHADGGPATDAPFVCPATAEECARTLFCPEVCRYPDVDAGAPETDAGAPDAGAACNPGVHTAACMNPGSCIGTDHVCRPCC